MTHTRIKNFLSSKICIAKSIYEYIEQNKKKRRGKKRKTWFNLTVFQFQCIYKSICRNYCTVSQFLAHTGTNNLCGNIYLIYVNYSQNLTFWKKKNTCTNTCEKWNHRTTPKCVYFKHKLIVMKGRGFFWKPLCCQFMLSRRQIHCKNKSQLLTTCVFYLWILKWADAAFFNLLVF
jgi:hypothetical protein